MRRILGRHALPVSPIHRPALIDSGLSNAQMPSYLRGRYRAGLAGPGDGAGLPPDLCEAGVAGSRAGEPAGESPI